MIDPEGGAFVMLFMLWLVLLAISTAVVCWVVKGIFF